MIGIKVFRPIELWDLETNTIRETNRKVSNLLWPSIFFPRNSENPIIPILSEVGDSQAEEISRIPSPAPSLPFCCKNVSALESALINFLSLSTKHFKSDILNSDKKL